MKSKMKNFEPKRGLGIGGTGEVKGEQVHLPRRRLVVSDPLLRPRGVLTRAEEKVRPRLSHRVSVSLGEG